MFSIIFCVHAREEDFQIRICAQQIRHNITYLFAHVPCVFAHFWDLRAIAMNCNIQNEKKKEKNLPFVVCESTYASLELATWPWPGSAMVWFVDDAAVAWVELVTS